MENASSTEGASSGGRGVERAGYAVVVTTGPHGQLDQRPCARARSELRFDQFLRACRDTARLGRRRDHRLTMMPQSSLKGKLRDSLQTPFYVRTGIPCSFGEARETRGYVI